MSNSIDPQLLGVTRDQAQPQQASLQLDRNETYQNELQLRSMIAHGLPSNSISCAYHREILDDMNMSREAAAKGEQHEPRFPNAAGVFNETVTSETALFPICTLCSGVTNLQLNTGDANSDGCHCATNIVASECWYCGLGIIQAKKVRAILHRTVRIQTPTYTKPERKVARLEMKCECGNLVQLPELARKCVGCDGVVRKPFRNFAGERMHFRFASTGLRSADGGSEQHVPSALPTYPVTWAPAGNGAKANEIQSIGYDLPDGDHSGAPPAGTDQPECDKPHELVDLSNWLPDLNDGTWDTFDFNLFGAQGDEYGLPSDFSLNTSEDSDGHAYPAPSTTAHTSQETDSQPKNGAGGEVLTPEERKNLQVLGFKIPSHMLEAREELFPGEKVEYLLLENLRTSFDLKTLTKALDVCRVPDRWTREIVQLVEEHCGNKPHAHQVLKVLRREGWIERMS